MGHLLFCIMHFFAIIFGFVLLFITVPLHIIYGVISGKNKRKAVVENDITSR